MPLQMPSAAALLIFALSLSLTTASARADDAKKNPSEQSEKKGEKKAAGKTLELAGGRVLLEAPAAWKSVKPRNRIIRFEFSAPPIKGDKNDLRITVTPAGGGVERNVNRWIGQFSQPDRKPTKERTKTQVLKVAGSKVHVVDIPGTFKDQPGGPFSRRPAIMRKGYRMLGAIIVTPKYGQYFVKLYGPAATVAKHEKAFLGMVKSLKLK